jgi:hypothetical protein
VRWLFLLGVSIDLAGAALVGWSVYAQSGAERREEALSKLGSNFWIVLFREEEQAYVRAGLFLLGIGFALQLIGYVVGFGWPAGALALVLAIVVGGAAFFIGNKRAARAVPIQLSRPDDRPRIVDERAGFGVATLGDVLTYRRLYTERMKGRKLRRGLCIVHPQISGGSWVFACPECGRNHMNLATPGLATVFCSTCCREFPARFPANHNEIEWLLLKRQRPEERNWKLGQATEELSLEAVQPDPR